MSRTRNLTLNAAVAILCASLIGITLLTGCANGERSAGAPETRPQDGTVSLGADDDSETARASTGDTESAGTSYKGLFIPVEGTETTRSELERRLGTSLLLPQSALLEAEPRFYFLASMDLNGPGFARIVYGDAIEVFAFPADHPDSKYEDLRATAQNAEENPGNWVDGRARRGKLGTVRGREAYVIERGTQVTITSGGIKVPSSITWREADGSKYVIVAPDESVGYLTALAATMK